MGKIEKTFVYATAEETKNYLRVQKLADMHKKMFWQEADWPKLDLAFAQPLGTAADLSQCSFEWAFKQLPWAPLGTTLVYSCHLLSPALDVRDLTIKGDWVTKGWLSLFMDNRLSRDAWWIEGWRLYDGKAETSQVYSPGA